MTLLVFHLDMFGNDDRVIQKENILLISTTLLVFHLDISGNDNKETQL